MLSKKNRLPTSAIRAFYDSGTKNRVGSVRGKYLNLKTYSRGLEFNRFGVVISAKVEPTAVGRNLWRRRVMSTLSTWPNYRLDCLLIAQGNLHGASILDMQNDLVNLQLNLDRHF